MLALRALGWCGVAALVVLGARALAYALVPEPTLLSMRLEHSAGGPRLVALTVGALGLAVAVATVAIGLAALAVRERAALERSPLVVAPRLRPLRFLWRFAVLFVAAATAFTLLESYLHWRAGLGWHGIHCLVGPVHRDAIPLLSALSLVAVAFAEALSHLLVWARRTIARLCAQPREQRDRPVARRRPRSAVLLPYWLGAPLLARGPPL